MILAAVTAPVSVTPLKPIPGARAIAFAAAPTGSRFAACLEDGTIRIYDAATRATLKTLGQHPQAPYAIAWSPDGKYIASGDESARIFIWDVTKGTRIKQYRTHTKGIQNLAFNPTSTQLLSTSKDDSVKMYDIFSTRNERTLKGGGANFYSARYIPKTGSFAVCTLTASQRVYTAGLQQNGSLTGHDDQGAFDIAINRFGNRAVSGGKDATAVVYDLVLRKRLGSLRGHSDWVMHTEYSPSGKIIATGSTDRSVKIWDGNSLQLVTTLEQQTSVGSPLAFTADGKYLLTVNLDDVIQINGVNPPQPGNPPPAPKTTKKKKRRG